MIIRVKFKDARDESDWFEACAHALEYAAGCKILKQKDYLRLHHAGVLLDLPDKEIFTMIAKSKKIHGFLYRGELYIHPAGFAKYYLRVLIKHIDSPVDEYVH